MLISEGTKKKGFGLAQYAEACHNLMQSLGYKKYGKYMFNVVIMLGCLHSLL